MNLRVFCFCLAFILYGVLGSPTPDHPGVIEALIGVLLIICAGLPYFFQTLPRQSAGTVLLLFYGLSVMIMLGAAAGHPIMDMARDIFPFLFLFLPALFAPFFIPRPQILKILIIFVGLAFSVRSLLPVYEFYPAPEELLYLANSPLVLLTALLLLSEGVERVARHPLSLIGLGMLSLSVIPLAAMMIDVLRAPMSATLMTMICVYAVIFVQSSRDFVKLSVLSVPVFVLLLPAFDSIGQEILAKTARVGLNMRAQELMAVMDVVTRDIWSALFGLGWGASFHAPSVGGLNVSYTHSFLSYFLLKGGLVGVLIAAAFLWRYVRMLVFARERGAVRLAAFWALFIPVFLYASYKSLDFGIVLLFIAAMRIGFDVKSELPQGSASRTLTSSIHHNKPKPAYV